MQKISLAREFPDFNTYFSVLHSAPECHGFLQLEQNLSLHAGQLTHWGWQPGQTVQMVSQPARGHQVRPESKSTSEMDIFGISYSPSRIMAKTIDIYNKFKTDLKIQINL